MQLIYTFKLSKVKMGIKLFRFDSTMKVLKKYDLLNGEKKFGPFPAELRKFGSKFYLLYYIYEEETGSLKLFIASIDPETLQPGEGTLLFEMPQANTGLFKSEKLYDAVSVQVKASPNDKKLLVSWSSTLSNRFYLAVLDKDLALEWKKDDIVAKTDKIQEFTSCLDDNGIAYTSYQYSTGKDEWVYKVGVYSFSGKLKEHEVKTRDSKVYQVLLIPSKSGKLVHVIGSYSEHPFALSGLYQKAISTADYLLQGDTQTPFSKELIEQLTADGWASTKEKKYGLNDVRLQGFELADGSLALVGMWRTTNWTGRATFNISGSLLHARIHEGVVRVASIPKYRVSAGSTIGDSYAAFPCGNKLFIFYNDNEDNLKRDPLKPPTSSNKYKNAVLAAAYFDGDGTIRREMVMNNADGFVPFGEFIRPVAPDKFLVPVLEVKGLGGIGDEGKWGTIKVKM
ncbi:hypothetical protein HB364_26930 [Pseudoflavitalea sp. X16]|uniref:hypothetical protein n=1 Tax=Paraflavitalea devenefica TaxID=2716334 RepID=UPI00142049A0|nr:hypothetical protein [Paraflavitalea devenefica]NII28745.1 hypothetical protein [Paraflavitalea devenefica]